MVASGMSDSVDDLVDYSPVDVALDSQIATLSGSVDRDSIRDPITAGHMAGWLLYRIIHCNQPLQEQFALFLHDHFVSDWETIFKTISPDIEDKGCVPNNPLNRERKAAELLKSQYGKFREFGHLHFRDMLVTITRDPAMLIYLDNFIKIGRAHV